MKIMYGITRSVWGGAQSHVFDLVNDQLARENEVVVVIGDRGDLYDRLQTLQSVKVHLLPAMQREISPLKDWVAVRQFRALIQQEKPDILHLHSSKAGAIGRLAARQTGCPVIFTAHGWAFTEGAKPAKALAYSVIERLLSPLADHIICVSQFDYQIAVKKGVIKPIKQQASVIYNGVQDPKFERQAPNRDRPLKLLMIARFVYPKMQSQLIEWVSRLSDPSQVAVTFVGDGPNEAACKAQAAAANLTNITFAGFQTDVSTFLAQNDVGVLATKYEGLPISIVESMAYKMPILATSVGGVKEQVQDGMTGRLVSSDLPDFTSEIADIADNYATYSTQSYQRYLANFQKQDMLESNAALYQSLS